MKKIFAIALALVMVLSMASAFASQCNVGPYDWSCSTSVSKCGKATVEVIPYVKANDACAGVKYVPSTCAGAVNTDEVYYVVKLSVDANPDKEWFDAATFSLTAKGIANTAGSKTAYTYTAAKGSFPGVEFTTDNAASAQVYYLNYSAGWTRYDVDNEATYEDKFVQTGYVFDAAKAKVCATIKSENKFTSAVVGDYTVTWVKNPSSGSKSWPNALLFENKDGEQVALYMDKNDKVQEIKAANVSTCNTEAALIADVLADYNFGCGYGLCITYDAVKANFGWKDKVEHCATWSANAQSVVDAECVVAIPKTGDASVLAWLF